MTEVREEEASVSGQHQDLPQPPLHDAIATTTPSPLDVLCGRGGASLRHPGNLNYRRLININKARYVACRKVEKLEISRSIVGEVKDHGGRFLERHWDEWHEIGDKKAVEKTSQALREGQPKLRQTMEVMGVEPSNGSDSTTGGHSPCQEQLQQQVMAQHQKPTSMQQTVFQEHIAQQQQQLFHVKATDETRRLAPWSLYLLPKWPETGAGAAIRDPSNYSLASISELPPTLGASKKELSELSPHGGPSETTTSHELHAPPGLTVKGSVEDHANLLLMFSRQLTRTKTEFMLSDKPYFASESERVARSYGGPPTPASSKYLLRGEPPADRWGILNDD
jgi:hypothetical protein